MGLDMFLNATCYILNESLSTEISNLVGILFPNAEVRENTVTVMSWRKANAIHNWFITNCGNGEDDCQPIPVSIDHLTKLRNLCKRVLDHSTLIPALIKNGTRYTRNSDGEIVATPIIEDGQTIANPSYAKRYLPTTSGFFFGSTEYDQYYYQDVKETYEALDAILKIPQDELNKWDFTYRASW